MNRHNHNRFEDVAVGDRVRCRSWKPIFPGEGKIVALHGDNADVEYRESARYDSPRPIQRVKLSDLTFACHNEGAPFTAARLSADEGYADGFKTGWTWPRDHWNHNPGGPGPFGTSTHMDCRHLQAYHDAGQAHCAAWHRGFKEGEALRLERRFNVVDLTQPLELDTGEPVVLKQIDSETYFVELLEDQRWQSHGMRKGVTVEVSVTTHNITCCFPRYVRNKLMIKSSIFAAGQRVNYLSGTGRSYGTGTIKSIENNIIITQIAGMGRREFNLSGKAINGCYDPEGRIEPIVTKRSGFILISTSAGDARFFLDLAEASEQFHLSDGSYVLCTCEQQADREGGEFRTINVGGPIEPLPEQRVRYITIPVDGSLYVTDSLHERCNPPTGRLKGDNLKLTFEGDRLVGAEVVAR